MNCTVRYYKGIIVDCECFHYKLYYLCLLFAKNIMGWGDIMTEIPLPHIVVEIARGWGYLFCWGENNHFGFW